MNSLFKIGDTVIHSVYGTGTVTNIHKTDYGFAVQINGRFSDYETKFTHA